MKNINWIQTLLTTILILGVTTSLYLYSDGYRLTRSQKQTVDLTKTGMISVKSMPEGASVYLDGILMTATNDTISGIEPGTRHLKIIKKGFVPWEKNIEVFKELVTDITAVLISQSSRLEPITNTGAGYPSISPSLSKMAYFAKNETKPGIMVISLGGGFGLFRTSPAIALEDTKFIKYSEGTSIEWSPDEKSLIITGADKKYYIVNMESNTAQVITNPEETRQAWREIINKKREEFVQKAEVDDKIKTLAMSQNAVWAPDEKKFLYIEDKGTTLDYKVYDLEKPLPVGEKIESVVFTANKTDIKPEISWYTDSFHLILTEGNIAKDKKGKISFIRIDGTNKTEIYNNTLLSEKVYSTPGGDKIVIATSFKSNDQTDLYTVSIR